MNVDFPLRRIFPSMIAVVNDTRGVCPRCCTAVYTIAVVPLVSGNLKMPGSIYIYIQKTYNLQDSQSFHEHRKL